MNKAPEVNINLADPKDVVEKLPRVEEILEEKERLSQEADREVIAWREKLRALRTLANVKVHVDGSAESQSPAQDLVITILEREGREMRPAEVAEALRADGHKAKSNDAVNAALHAAASAGRVRRPKPRHYAPLETK